MSLASSGLGRQEAGQVGNHAAGLHASPEAHGAKDQENGVEHAHHAPGDQQAVHFGVTGFQRYCIVDAFDGSGQEDTGAGAFGDFCTDAFNDSRLEDEGGDGRDQDGNRQDRKGRHPFQNQHKRQHWNDEQPGSDAELFGQDGSVQVNLGPPQGNAAGRLP